MLSLDRHRHKVRIFPLFIPMPATIRTDKQRTIIFVGRLSYRDKRVDRLLRIWQSAQDALPDWQLRIIGTGPEQDNLKSYAQQLGLKRLRFEGQSYHVQSYYDMASILCLTSSFEGWPLCVAEAQSNGVIPIVFDSFAGAHDLIRNQDEGILVEPFDEKVFSRELITLATDRERMSAMRASVMKKASQYDINVVGTVWEAMGGEMS